MPEPTKLTISASEVKPGDRINDALVDAVARKAKYTHISFVAAGTPALTLLHDFPLAVVRYVKTETEKFTEQCDFAHEMLQSAITQAHQEVAKALEYVNESAKYTLQTQWGPLDAYMTALANRDLWAAIERATQNGHDGLEATAAVARDARDSLLTDQFRGSSSNHVSRAADAYSRAAASQFLRAYPVTFALKNAKEA